MQSIKAIYDGTDFVPQQPIPINGSYNVIITFVEPVLETEKLPITSIKGILKGKITMSDDFDESLEEIFETEKLPIESLFGKFAGKIRMSEDFDEPLEEMRDYM
ncbi:MAG: DUF2281 domain-containing protein [Firmicutes bacterium]|nr:DUF2281 domain-containing protein [Bacillota bacterium]